MNPRNDLILLSDAAYTVRVSEHQMSQLVANRHIAVLMTADGQSITRSDFESIAHSAEVRETSLQALIREIQKREEDESSSRNAYFSEEIARRAIRHRQYIQTLEEIHRHYHDRLDVLRVETAVAAAYILYAKVIRLLNMACLCLGHYYWETLVLLRPIDEAVDLAQYFILMESTDEGAANLRKWFRENWSPRHKVCRLAIGTHMESVGSGSSGRPFAEIMYELHGKKSKELHHTFNGMIEIHQAKLSNGRPVSAGFDYGPCSYPRKVFEVTEFFQTSIWTAVQGFLLCFQERLPLEQDHITRLMNLNQIFLEESQ